MHMEDDSLLPCLHPHRPGTASQAETRLGPGSGERCDVYGGDLRDGFSCRWLDRPPPGLLLLLSLLRQRGSEGLLPALPVPFPSQLERFSPAGWAHHGGVGLLEPYIAGRFSRGREDDTEGVTVTRQGEPRMLVTRADRHTAVRVGRGVLCRGCWRPGHARRAPSQGLSQR